MRRFLVVFALALLACQATSQAFLPATGREARIDQAATATPILSPTVRPTATSPPTASPTPAALAVPTYLPTIPEQRGFTTRYHPDGPLYVGDRVSIEVIAPEGFGTEGKKVQIFLGDDPQDAIGSAEFSAYGIGGRPQATFLWAWDTSGLTSGEYTLSFAVLPDGLAWSEVIRLHPAADVPPPEPFARWETVETACCRLHYITGTEAERDLEEIIATANAAAREASRQMGVGFETTVSITLVPRVVGHGGFASDEIFISYLDRNYAGNDLPQVLLHEMIHVLDSQIGGELRPSILVEGLAVYLAGGHFKKEPIFPRAAALLEAGWYLPLGELADTFYTSQHEIGYLEGAALVAFLVETYGREGFEAFYRDIRPQSGGEQSRAIDAAIQAHFNLTLAQVEQEFKQALRRQPVDPVQSEDLQLSIAFYDTVRRYQRALDPSAFFLTAWLPDGGEMRERGIVADYLRRPRSAGNQVIESLLVEADEALRAGDYPEARSALERANRQLDWLEYPAPAPVQGSFILLLAVLHGDFRLKKPGYPRPSGSLPVRRSAGSSSQARLPRSANCSSTWRSSTEVV